MVETIVIEKEVWESTLRASMDRAAKIEVLQDKLDIALSCLHGVITSDEALRRINEVPDGSE